MPIHVFRYDDFSACSCTSVEEKMADIFLRHHISCTFAVVPFACDPALLLDAGGVKLCPLSKAKAALLQPLLKAGLAEIALHGYCHLSLAPVRGYQEFSDRMPIETQRRLLQQGRRHLEAVFGTRVQLYVPPWNRLARSTAALLQEEHFLLAGDCHEKPDAALLALPQLPSATEIHDTERALVAARRYGGDDSAVGTMLHDYDFAESGLGVSSLKLEEFEKLLCRWQAVPNVRRQLIAKTITDFPADGGDRIRANCAFRQDLHRSRMGRKLFAATRHVYWDKRTALRLSRIVKFVP